MVFSHQITVYFFMGAMLISGTANTLIAKEMDLTKSRGEKFRHPYFQAATMFLGEI